MHSLMDQGVKRFVVINGHGGNTPSIDRAALEVYHKGGVCASIDWWSLVAELDDRFKGGHGDVLETSAVMAIAPEAVHLELGQPINAQNPTDELKAAYIQAVNFKGGTCALCGIQRKSRPADGSVPLTRRNLRRSLDRRLLIWRQDISVTLWAK